MSYQPRRALIGSSGFVGGILRESIEFAGLFRSRNISELADSAWDEVICAGMPAEKWRANKEPEADGASLRQLWTALERTDARRVVLISTVDVFDPPAGKDEAAPPDAAHPYGRNRAELEHLVVERFEDVAVVRLPGLYGPGLKKNALYDLITRGRSDTPREARFQWYDVERLAGDLDAVCSLGISLVQLVSEPVAMGDIVERCFPAAEVAEGGSAARYDLRTRHADAFGGRDGYLLDRDASLAGITRFVERARKGEVECASPSP